LKKFGNLKNSFSKKSSITFCFNNHFLQVGDNGLSMTEFFPEYIGLEREVQATGVFIL
jgi:hypothetical protein